MRSEPPLLYIVAPQDLAPEFAGIGPRLQGPDDDSRDFVIPHEEKAGSSGLTNVTDIELAGTTAALAIAGYVGRMMS